MKEKYLIQVRELFDWQTVDRTDGESLAKIIANDLRVFTHPVRIWHDGESVWSSVDGAGYRIR